VTTELLLRGIGAGAVPRDALLCELGGTKWRWIGEIPPFSIALNDQVARPPLDSTDDVTLSNQPLDALGAFDDATDHTQTTVELPRRWFESLADMDERTIVDFAPLTPSDPPTAV
jgi:hypothetical protein